MSSEVCCSVRELVVRPSVCCGVVWLCVPQCVVWCCVVRPSVCCVVLCVPQCVVLCCASRAPPPVAGAVLQGALSVCCVVLCCVVLCVQSPSPSGRCCTSRFSLWTPGSATGPRATATCCPPPLLVSLLLLPPAAPGESGGDLLTHQEVTS